MRNEVCKLRAKKIAGSEVSWKETTVFCEVKSMVASEFYAGYAVGLSLKYTIEIDPDDFIWSQNDGNDPCELIYNNKTYVIVRTYKRNNSTLEIKAGEKL